MPAKKVKKASGKKQWSSKPKRKPPIMFYVTRDPVPQGVKSFGCVALWAVIGKSKPRVTLDEDAMPKHPCFNTNDKCESVLMGDTASFACEQTKAVAKLLGLAKLPLDTGERRRVRLHVTKEQTRTDQVPVWLDGGAAVCKARKARASVHEVFTDDGYQMSESAYCHVASLYENLNRLNVEWFGKKWKEAHGAWWVSLEMVA